MLDVLFFKELDFLDERAQLVQILLRAPDTRLRQDVLDLFSLDNLLFFVRQKVGIQSLGLHNDALLSHIVIDRLLRVHLTPLVDVHRRVFLAAVLTHVVDDRVVLDRSQVQVSVFNHLRLYLAFTSVFDVDGALPLSNHGIGSAVTHYQNRTFLQPIEQIGGHLLGSLGVGVVNAHFDVVPAGFEIDGVSLLNKFFVSLHVVVDHLHDV